MVKLLRAGGCRGYILVCLSSVQSAVPSGQKNVQWMRFQSDDPHALYALSTSVLRLGLCRLLPPFRLGSLS